MLDYLFSSYGENGRRKLFLVGLLFVYMFAAFCRNYIFVIRVRVRVLWSDIRNICNMPQKRKVTTVKVICTIPCNWTVPGLRAQDLSFPRTNSPYGELSFPRLFVPGNFRFVGTFVPWERKFPGTFVPGPFRSRGTKVPGNFRSLDLSFRGTFVPRTFRSPGTFVPPTILQGIGYERRQL